MEIELKLQLEEVNGLLTFLGELPTKTNAWLLCAKIQAQLTPQLPQEKGVEHGSAASGGVRC